MKQKSKAEFKKTSCKGYAQSDGFPGGSNGKESACSVGNLGSIHGLRRSPGEGNGNPLQYLVWEIPWTKGPGGQQSMGSKRVRHD